MLNSNTNPTKINDLNTQLELLAKALHDLKNDPTAANIQLHSDFGHTDRFMTTRTFPFSLPELSSLSSDNKKWQKIINAVPHLFQKQKVVYLVPKRRNLLNARIADKLYKHDFEERMIYLKSTKDFRFLQNQNQKGIIFQEYIFNYQRFFIEVLKYFEHKGGRVSFSTDAVSIAAERKPAVLIPVKTYPKFELVVKKGDSFIRFTEKGENILATQIDKKSAALSANQLITIAGKYFKTKSEKAKTQNIESPPDIDIIYEIVLLVEGKLHCSFESFQLNDYYEICLEKFDLAKQTGIAFEDFKIYFHRYGKGIDEITETAYELLEKNRNTKEVWQSAETVFQSKYEWKNESAAN